jgi:hypothetical protein
MAKLPVSLTWKVITHFTFTFTIKLRDRKFFTKQHLISLVIWLIIICINSSANKRPLYMHSANLLLISCNNLFFKGIYCVIPYRNILFHFNWIFMFSFNMASKTIGRHNMKEATMPLITRDNWRCSSSSTPSRHYV